MFMCVSTCEYWHPNTIAAQKTRWLGNCPSKDGQSTWIRAVRPLRTAHARTVSCSLLRGFLVNGQMLFSLRHATHVARPMTCPVGTGGKRTRTHNRSEFSWPSRRRHRAPAPAAQNTKNTARKSRQLTVRADGRVLDGLERDRVHKVRERVRLVERRGPLAAGARLLQRLGVGGGGGFSERGGCGSGAGSACRECAGPERTGRARGICPFC